MNVLITRAAEQLAETVNIFSSHGLFPYCMPIIQSVALEAPEFKYDSYDYCILTSPTAVKFFAPHKIVAKKYVAVGTATAKAICELLKVPEDCIFTPNSAYIGEIENFFTCINITGKKIVAPGALERIKDIGDLFRAGGAYFDAPALYETVAALYNKKEIESVVNKYCIKAVTFFSPSAVSAFFDQAALPDDIITAAIGKTTADSLTMRGRTPVCGEEQTAESLALTLKQIEKKR